MHSRISCKRSLGCSVGRSVGRVAPKSIGPSVRPSVSWSHKSWVSEISAEFRKNSIRNMRLCHWKDKTSMQADHQNASDDLIWLDLLDAFSFLFFFVRLSVRPSVRQLVTQIDNLRNAIFGWSFDKIASWTWNCVFWGTIWRQIREQIARMHLLA